LRESVPIVIQRNGRMANCMIQYILARELAERVGGEVTIYGQSLPEWGIALPVFPEPDIEAAKGRLVLYGCSPSAPMAQIWGCDLRRIWVSS
jgi:hypothetical protein